MSLDRILATLPEKSRETRDRMRNNATRIAGSGTPKQQAGAANLTRALDDFEARAVEEICDTPVAERVIRAFTARPLSETELKLLTVLLSHPGATSTELTQQLGWRAQFWHPHFGTMCQNREADLWPAKQSVSRPGKYFWTGIPATYDKGSSTFTMKPEVVTAAAPLGIRGKDALTT
jgi:hypothetical protein